MSIEARRHSPRVLLTETAYVNFGSGNRGVILDISEGGLRFKTNTPVDKSDSVRFWLALSRRSEGAAQVAWTDESRTTGGLRFTTVPPEVRQQIRDWIERGASDDPKRQATITALQIEEQVFDALLIESALAVAETQARDVSAFDVASTTAAEAVALSSAESLDPGTPAELEKRAERATSYATPFSHATHEKIRAGDLFQKPRPMLVGEDESLSMFPSEATSSGGVMFTAPPPKRHPVAVTVLVLLILLSAAAVAGEYYYPSQARAWMSRAQAQVQRFVNPDHKQPVADVEPASMAGSSRFEGSFEPGKPSENASVVPATPTAPASPQSDANAAVGSSDRQADPSRSSAAAPAAEIPAPKTNAETELELAQTYLAKGSSPDQQAKAVELLWLATEKGNVDAEIQLADLYATGEAVQKSCVQARILLKAAAASNPGVAKPKLDALDQSGCS